MQVSQGRLDALAQQCAELNFGSDFLLLIDKREKKLDERLTTLRFCRSATLPVADYWFVFQGRLLLVIEFKTLKDLWSSTTERKKRAKEQSFRLPSLPIPSSRIVWLFQKGRQGMDADRVNGKMANIVFRDCQNVWLSESPAGTLALLLKLVLKVAEHVKPQSRLFARLMKQTPLLDYILAEMNSLEHEDEKNKYRSVLTELINVGCQTQVIAQPVLKEYQEDPEDKISVTQEDKQKVYIVRSMNQTQGSAYLSALRSVPQVSVERARTIAQEWPSLLLFLTEYQRNKDTLTQRIAQLEVRGRRLGNKLAQRVVTKLTESV